MDRVLKGETTKPDALRNGTIDLPVGGLTIVLVVLAMLYGACMGSFAVVARWGGAAAGGGRLQFAYSAVKVPMLYFHPPDHFPVVVRLNALVGCRLNFGAILRLLVAALAVTLAVLASFGTIVVFFSLCTTSYPFMVLLNVLMFAIAGILGMSFLLPALGRLAIVQSAAEMVAASETPPPQMPPGSIGSVQRSTSPSVRIVFAIWVRLFGLIGAQMG